VDASRTFTMSSAFDDCLRTHGTILKSLSPGLYEAALPNGKPVISHLSRELAVAPPEIPDGATVLLEISPFDLDRARIAEVVDD
jgi:translation initiation factor IF-1